MLGRWPHPSPWWGEVFWPAVIVVGLPLLLAACFVDAMVSNWLEDRRDGGG